MVPRVKDVIRDENKRPLLVIIDYYPFKDLKFKLKIDNKGRKKVCLVSFNREDDCRDDPDFLPSNIFRESIKLARAILMSTYKKTKKNNPLQARFF